MELQTNCSELVTHLGFQERREIIEALKEINGNGETWKIVVVLNTFKDKMVIPVPNDLMEQAISVGETQEEGNTYKEIYIRDIQDYIWKFIMWRYSNIDEQERNAKFNRIKQDMADKGFDRDQVWKSISILKDCPDDIKTYGEEERMNLVYIRLSMGDGYCGDNSLTVGCTQHCCTSEFPIFHRIRELFNSDYECHDGGDTITYEQWMSFWFNDERGFTHHSYLSGAGIEGTEIREHDQDEDFQEFPPIQRTTSIEVPNRSVPDRHQRELDGIFTNDIFSKKKKKVDTKRKLGD